MDRNQIRKKINAILVEIMGDESVLTSDNIKEMGIDSLKIVKIFVLIEQEFDIEFEDEQLLFDNYTSVDDVVLVIQEKL